ncbi:cytochrome c oxidase subunit 2 [Pseudomonas pohangensis]|uniref:Cytochrome c oxidase subunit 2 n=1 Tax=Pseudomonas pohangensis TaxID=364197 RepID=A0A1H2FRP8_9PSED|nr:c-type cytochrome [Pseudomonas pohangensis]SDU10027.1 cytochrome c oxidase subunit 2 [Pseudomonas pohangensis]
MKQLFPALLMIGLSATTMVQAADTAPGKALFEATCVACHGAQGQGNPALSAPALAGQQAVYLQRQLLNFRSGLRGAADGDSGAASMVPMAKSLPDDAAVTAVADYLASLPAVAAKPDLSGGDAAQGAKLYQSKCGSCHGGKAEGNPAFSAPALAGQSDTYLQTQFNNFKQGKRGYDKTDRYGRQMKLMANTINDTEFLDVLAYLNTLGAR